MQDPTKVFFLGSTVSLARVLSIAIDLDGRTIDIEALNQDLPEWKIQIGGVPEWGDYFSFLEDAPILRFTAGPDGTMPVLS